MKSPEYQPSNSSWPNLNVIRELKSKHSIANKSPNWWSTDYKPDPREFLSFEEFERRLVRLGGAKTLRCPFGLFADSYDFFGFYEERHVVKREVCLYPNHLVPITIIDLEINGQDLPFLVTARPCPRSDEYALSLDKVAKEIEFGKLINIPEMYYPHIRGLFAGKRGNHFFWYDWNDYESALRTTLEARGLSFLNIWSGGGRRYADVWFELKMKENLVDQRRPILLDFPRKEVSAEEFLADWQNVDQDLVVFYPLRLQGLSETLPMVISTRTHKESRLRKPTVLGVFAENGADGFCQRGGILRIKNLQMAESVSQLLTQDFGIPIDTVLFVPTPGRPRYERISG